MKRVFYSCLSSLILCFFFIRTSAQSNIIGNPIKIGNIEVAQNDFPYRMKWSDANQTCLNLGEGWRLPTKDELNILYINKNQIGNLQDPYQAYWSSTEVDNNFAWYGVMKDGFTRSTEKFYESGVRAVRNSININESSLTQNNIQQTFTFQNGDKYVGEIKNGNRNGQGTYTFSNGDKYIGEWKDGNMSGQGTYTYSNGNKYVGEWENGIRNGFGTFTFTNGATYIGNFKDNQWNGQGTYTSIDGSIQKGIYQNGSLIEEKKLEVDQDNRPLKIGSTVKIGQLEVAQNDIGIMSHDKALKACDDLGNGWRLPTKEELYIMYQNRYKLKGISRGLCYWTSSEGNEKDNYWIGPFFGKGTNVDGAFVTYAFGECVRPVRTLGNSNSTTTKKVEKNIVNLSNKKNPISIEGYSLDDLMKLAIRAELGEKPNLDPESDFVNPEYNAWQCRKCGQLSRSKKEPCCGEFGDCTKGYIRGSYSPHSFVHANTNRGYQCTRCGLQAFTFNNNNGKPSGGDFGKCRSESDHNWRAF